MDFSIDFEWRIARKFKKGSKSPQNSAEKKREKSSLFIRKFTTVLAMDFSINFEWRIARHFQKTSFFEPIFLTLKPNIRKTLKKNEKRY